MQKYTDVVTSARSGAAIPNARVTVKTYPGAVLATIYSDDGITTQDNPITTDSNGEFSFYAADGRYQLTVSGTGITERTVTDVLLADPDDGTEEQSAADVTFTPSGSGASSESVQAVIRRIVRDVQGYGATGDGTTDDRAAIVAAIAACSDGDVLFFSNPSSFYRISAEIDVAGKRIHFFGHGAEIRFDDASANGFHFNTSSQRCTVEGLYLRSNDTTTPNITLIKNDGTSAYFTVKHCKFAYADIAISLDNTYVVKLRDNEYSNCDTFIHVTNAGGAVINIQIYGETFGAAVIGTDACVLIDAPGVQMDGCEWETDSQTKKSLHVQDGSQDFYCRGKLTDSGEVHVETNVVARLDILALDCWSNNRTIRVDSGGRCNATGSTIRLSAVQAGVVGVSSAGTFVMSGGVVDKYETGISASGGGTVDASDVTSCTTGIALSSGATMEVGNRINYTGTTTQITNSSGGSAAAPGSFTASLSGCTAAVTGTARFEINDGWVVLTLPALSGTSNTTAATITGLPTAIQPSGGFFTSAILLLDNGAQSVEQCSITTDTITLYKNASATGFTNSGTKGVRAQVITYRLRNV